MKKQYFILFVAFCFVSVCFLFNNNEFIVSNVSHIKNTQPKLNTVKSIEIAKVIESENKPQALIPVFLDKSDVVETPVEFIDADGDPANQINEFEEKETNSTEEVEFIDADKYFSEMGNNNSEN